MPKERPSVSECRAVGTGLKLVDSQKGKHVNSLPHRPSNNFILPATTRLVRVRKSTTTISDKGMCKKYAPQEPAAKLLALGRGSDAVLSPYCVQLYVNVPQVSFPAAHNGFCSRRQHGSHETYPLRRDFQENLSFASGCLNLELSLQLAAFFIIGAYYIGGQAVPVDERAFVLGASLGGYEDPGFSCPKVLE